MLQTRSQQAALECRARQATFPTDRVNAPASLPAFTCCSQGVTLTYGQVKRLLLSTVDIIGGKAAAATSTGGRLNIGAAMQALSLLLQVELRWW